MAFENVSAGYSTEITGSPSGILGRDERPPTLVADGDIKVGDGIRNLPEPLKKALLDLRGKFESDSDRARREYVKRCLKNHMFFAGAQWDWMWQANAWRGVSQTGGVAAAARGAPDQSLHVLNIFQGYALSIISLIAGNRMTIKFHPGDATNPADVAVAKKADVVMRAFERNERMFSQLVKTVYLLWCDGTVGSYVRTRVDGETYGFHDEPQMAMAQKPVGQDQFRCPICQATYMDNNGGTCPDCGAPMPAAPNVPAPQAPMWSQVGTRKVPNGQTVRDIVGGMELLLPPMAEKQQDFLYLIRRREVDKALPRATYPELADKIGMAGSAWPDTGGNQDFERRARFQAAHGLTAENRPVVTTQLDYVTLSECWFRPTAFYRIDDLKIRNQLLDMFPGGVKVVFANDVLCEAKPESMDDHWRVCHALPGRGQIREPIGGSLVQIQEIVNDLTNIIRDTIEYTMPITFVDTEMVDLRKLARSNAMAGAMYPVNRRGDNAVSAGFYQTAPGQMPNYATTFLDNLRTSMAQFATGAFPAAYGGGTPGNNTAQGISIERNAALGRISLYLSAIKEHYADWGPLVVKDFKGNALMPITLTQASIGGGFTQDVVKPEDFEFGNIQLIAEVDEDYPTTWPQQQALLLQLMQQPLGQGMLGLLKNMTAVKHTLGTTLDVPGEAAYARQWKLIDQLLTAAPEPGPPQPVMDPMTGQPVLDPMTGQPQMQPGQPQSSIQPNPLDDNAPMFQACVDFWLSDRGLQAEQSNPEGFQNFMLHALARQAAMSGGAPPMPGAPPSNQMAPGAAAPGAPPSTATPDEAGSAPPGPPPE